MTNQEETSHAGSTVSSGTAKKIDSLVESPPQSGKLRLTLKERVYWLRRPTIGEQWGFDESYAAVIEREREDLEWAKEQLASAGIDLEAPDAKPSLGQVLAMVRNVNPQEAAKRRRGRQEMLLGWWLEVFGVLASDLPADLEMGDLPPFLTEFVNVGLAQEAWARNPQGPGSE